MRSRLAPDGDAAGVVGAGDDVRERVDVVQRRHGLEDLVAVAEVEEQAPAVLADEVDAARLVHASHNHRVRRRVRVENRFEGCQVAARVVIVAYAHRIAAVEGAVERDRIVVPAGTNRERDVSLMNRGDN